MKNYILLIVTLLYGCYGYSQKAESLYNNLSLQDAIVKYENKLKKNADDGEAIYNLANTYRLNNESIEAEKWFAKSVTASKNPKAKFYYAQMLLMNGKTSQAKVWFKNYKQHVSGKEATRINSFVELCSLVEKNKVEEKNFDISSVVFNSDKMDFSPNYYGEDLIFVSNRSESRGSATGLDDWTDDKYTDLFVISTKNGSEVKRFSKKINSKLHEGSSTFTKDLSTLYLTRSNLIRGKSKIDKEQNIRLQIMESNKEDDSWSKPKKLSFNNDNYSYCHPTLSADNITMIFASDMPGGFGGMDLYEVKRTGEGWGTPKNLGNKINTSGNEVFPFLDAESNLYFSSNFHPGFGGLDVFKTQEGNGKWKTPENIGLPLNSLKDDFGIISKDSFKSGYFSSDRSGQDEIYSFKKGENTIIHGVVVNCASGEPIEGASVTINQNGNKIKKLISDKDGKFSFEAENNMTELDAMAEKSLYKTNEECTGMQSFNVKEEPILSLGLYNNIKENTGLRICGQVLNKDCNYLLDDTKITIINVCNGESYKLKSDKDGKFNFPLTKNCKYKVIAEKDYFTKMVKIIETDSTMKDCYDLELAMNSEVDLRNPSLGFEGSNQILLKEGTTIDLYNIYFNFDKYDLRPDGKEELEWVRQILKDYPTMKVQISAHTDSRAPDAYNITLSKNRAESVKKYLINEGVDGGRISSKGYGENKLKNRCSDGVQCSEIEHQRNRRVEFTIVSFEGEAIVSKEWKTYKR